MRIAVLALLRLRELLRQDALHQHRRAVGERNHTRVDGVVVPHTHRNDAWLLTQGRWSDATHKLTRSMRRHHSLC